MGHLSRFQFQTYSSPKNGSSQACRSCNWCSSSVSCDPVHQCHVTQFISVGDKIRVVSSSHCHGGCQRGHWTHTADHERTFPREGLFQMKRAPPSCGCRPIKGRLGSPNEAEWQSRRESDRQKSVDLLIDTQLPPEASPTTRRSTRAEVLPNLRSWQAAGEQLTELSPHRWGKGAHTPGQRNKAKINLTTSPRPVLPVYNSTQKWYKHNYFLFCTYW